MQTCNIRIAGGHMPYNIQLTLTRSAMDLSPSRNDLGLLSNNDGFSAEHELFTLLRFDL